MVVFVNGQNRPTAIAFDLETGIWGQPASLNTQTFTNLAPAAVASGGRRFDMVYVGADGIPRHRVLKVTAANFVPGVAQTGISIVGAETALNEVFNTAPVLVASGYGKLELIGRGLGNRLYQITTRKVFRLPLSSMGERSTRDGRVGLASSATFTAPAL